MIENKTIKKVVILSLCLETTSCSYNSSLKVGDTDLITSIHSDNTSKSLEIPFEKKRLQEKNSLDSKNGYVFTRENICIRSLKYFSNLIYEILPMGLGDYIDELISLYSVELKEDIKKLDSNDILVRCRNIDSRENITYKEALSLEKEILDLLHEVPQIVIDDQVYHSKSIKYLKKRISDYTTILKKQEEAVKKLVKKKYIEEICKGNYSDKAKLDRSYSYITKYVSTAVSEELAEQIKSASKFEFDIKSSISLYTPLYKNPTSIDFTEDSILNRLDTLGVYSFTTVDKFNNFLLNQRNFIQIPTISKTQKTEKVKNLFNGLFNCAGSGNTIDLSRKGLIDLGRWKHKTNSYTNLSWNCGDKRAYMTFVADKETIQDVSTKFYNQGSSPTCAYNSIGRGLFILKKLINHYEYKDFLIKVGIFVNKILKVNVIKKIENFKINEITKQNLINIGLYYFVVKQIFDYSSKKEAKREVNENSQKIDEGFAIHIMKCIRRIVTIDLGDKAHFALFLKGITKYHINRFEFQNNAGRQIFEAMVRVIIQNGISFMKGSSGNPLPYRVSRYIKRKTNNQYRLVPEHTQNFTECVNTITNSIDNKLPIIGAFFYGFDDDKKKGWHAMNIIGYMKTEGETGVIGFMVLNPWPTTAIDGENINIGYFSYENMKSCMWKGHYETIRFIKN